MARVACVIVVLLLHVMMMTRAQNIPQEELGNTLFAVFICLIKLFYSTTSIGLF